jgi:HPt (histidine-containing phosphotransfer) domain-containing protein
MENSGKSEGITDLSYLVELSKGNTQFVKDMVKIFLDENPGEIGMLEKGIREKDFNLINASAHKLRSTVPFIGIDQYIDKEITEIEKLAVNKSDSVLPREQSDPSVPVSTDKATMQKIEELFVKIKEVCIQACDELSAYS